MLKADIRVLGDWCLEIRKLGIRKETRKNMVNDIENMSRG